MQTFPEVTMSFKAYFSKDLFEFRGSSVYYLLPVVVTLFGILIFRILLKKKLNLPPGPWGLPIVGYLPFLGNEPFKTLDKLSKKYGNVFSLYLGQSYVVILADYPALKDAFSNQATLDRPPGIFDIQPDQFGVSNANGRQWVELRRFVARTMKKIGFGRSTWESLIQDEISEVLTKIKNENPDSVNLGNILESSVTNNIASLIFGRKLENKSERDMLNSALKAILEFFENSCLWNFFPWLCNILVKLKIGSYHKSFSAMVFLNTFVRKEIESHKKCPGDFREPDFVNNFMQAANIKQDKDAETILNEKNLIGCAQTLFVAGSETAGTSLMWLFLAMATYPNVQEKIHLELDSVLGKRRSSWEDHLKLPYTYAALMESLRWKTVGPINVARMTSEDIKICGYDVPKGTTVLALFWSIHNDSRYWPNPEKFIPERLLINNGEEVDLTLDSYTPFSYGKRRCPGESVAMIEMFLYFTAIMQIYEIRAPNGGTPNLDAVVGITYRPVSQKLCLKPR